MADLAASRRLLEKFRDIAVSRVTSIGSGWVQIEQGEADEALVDELARQLHTLKGEARTLGLAGPTALAEQVEELFHRARTAGFKVPTSVGDVFLSGMDALGALLLTPACDGPVDPALLTQLGQWSASSPLTVPARAPKPLPSTEKRNEFLRIPAARLALLSELALELRVGDTQARFQTSRLRGHLREITEMVGRLRMAQRSGQADTAAGLADMLHAQARLAVAEGHALDERGHQRALQLDSLDLLARELRLVPLSSLLVAHPRAVRDMALELGKEAVLSVEGDQLEADKRVLEALEEPLLHLLRNSIDHGIESPEERKALGKSPVGKVRIVAAQPAPDRLTLTVHDDGRGASPVALRDRAVQRGLLSAVEAAALQDMDALALIFQPGFTTRDTVGSLSGRGVGMDVVKRRAEELGGSVSVESVVGQGMRTTLQVPISVSRSHVLLLPSEEGMLAVPALGVEEVQRVASADPALPLTRVLGRASPKTPDSWVLQLQSGNERLRLSVPQIKGEAELVVRPLERPALGAKLLSGAGLLPSGELALVLNVVEVIRRGRAASRAVPDS